VDVSTDGGATWAPAELVKPPTNAPGRAWAKTLFRATVKIPDGAVKDGKGGFEIICKATDESYNTQPESVVPIWNIRGLINNAWHRVPVTVTDE
jgi:sulfite oxidase